MELKRQGAIFDLKLRDFYLSNPSLDTAVWFQGKSAGTALGPASGPQSQMVQNIVLAWLGGARIIELKTVQINDELKIPRPCIYVPNIGYNVEFSQELKIQNSLREYVGGSMAIEILHAAGVLGNSPRSSREDTQLDLSLGYSLEGIQSRNIRDFVEGLKDAGKTVEAIRRELPKELGKLRDIPFKKNIVHNITLSTFHGCLPTEIEGIVDFLLTKMDMNVVIKMNPTLLGLEQTQHLFYEKMGYKNIRLNEPAYGRDMQFDVAVAMVKRLKKTADSRGRKLGVKMTNTLEVMNDGARFGMTDRVMYLSGEPLHVLALTLVGKWREIFTDEIPISFAAGVDQFNFAELMGIGLTPITTCTDLLRAGGYGRLPKYLKRLEERMKSMGVKNIPDYIIKNRGKGEEAIRNVMGNIAPDLSGLNPIAAVHVRNFLKDIQKKLTENLVSSSVDLAGVLGGALTEVRGGLGMPETHTLRKNLPLALENLHEKIKSASALLNTPDLCEKTQNESRYTFSQTNKHQKRVGTTLDLFDCVSCDKCVPVCPNDANFIYEVKPLEASYRVIEWTENGSREKESGIYKVKKAHQIANFADFCNECGDCDTYCPEYGGPYIKKPRFFGSRETFMRHKDRDGLVIEKKRDGTLMLGRIMGREYLLEMNGKIAHFSDDVLRAEFDAASHEIIKISPCGEAKPGHTLDLRWYFAMRAILDGVLDSRRINAVNISFVPASELPTVV